MANETLRSLSKRLGIPTVDVSNKSSEFERLVDVRGCSLTLTSVARSVICLEIAANNSQVPVDKVSYDCKIMTTNWFCPGVPVNKGITIVLSLFRSRWLAFVYCLVFCISSCVPVHEDRTHKFAQRFTSALSYKLYVVVPVNK